MGLKRDFNPLAEQDFSDYRDFVGNTVQLAGCVMRFEFDCVDLPIECFVDDYIADPCCRLFSLVLMVHHQVPRVLRKLREWQLGQECIPVVESLDAALIQIIEDFELAQPLKRFWDSRWTDNQSGRRLFETGHMIVHDEPYIDHRFVKESKEHVFEIRCDYERPYRETVFEGVACFSSISGPLRIAIKKAAVALLVMETENDELSELESEAIAKARISLDQIGRAESASSRNDGIILTPLQLEILRALEGKVLRKKALADLLCKGHGSSLYKNGGIGQLIALGLVAKCKAGYYRPDAPPEGLFVGPKAKPSSAPNRHLGAQLL
ncbi:MAG: hypothetical protein KF777_17960 [Planctomycetaceae bacterium]|nr:hypothetical protein [Planctomycetaceae bacterium]